MRTTQPTVLVTAQTSPKKAVAFDNDFTLPDGHQDTKGSRTVMWHGPDPKGSGARSAVPISAPVASAVTGGVPTPPGAALAGGAHEAAAQSLVRQKTESATTVSSQSGDAKHDDDTATESKLSKTQETKTPLNWIAWSQRLEQVSASCRGPLTAEKQAFDVIELGRVLMRIREADRISRKDTVATETTIDVYRRKCAQIDKALQHTDLNDHLQLQQVMTRHAPKKQTFSLFRSALKWRAAAAIQALLKSQSALQRTAGRDFNWFRHVDELLKAMMEFSKIDALDRADCLESAGLKGKPARSKRINLSKLPAGWQERFLNEIESHPTYRDAGVLLRFCGMRPVELAQGVRVTATSEGIAVRIFGGKVRKTAGQPWRLMVLDPTMLPPAFVHRVQKAGEITVTAQEGAMRAYLARLTDLVFKQGKFWEEGVRKTNHVLSAYTFRHALATDLRANGWKENAIAGAIGECSAETAGLYGMKIRSPRGCTRTPAIVQSSVVCSRPVKPKDTRGLDQVMKKKKALSSKSRPS